MSKEEIALQLTLKSIEKLESFIRPNSVLEDSERFSNQVVNFYNNIYKKLDLDNTINM